MAAACPAPDGGGMKAPAAACNCASESIRKFAEVTTWSPALAPFKTTIRSPTCAEFRFPRLDVAVAPINKQEILGSRMKCGRSRYHHLPPKRQSDHDVNVHARPQVQSRIWKDEANREGSGRNIYLRKQVIHPPTKDLTGIR